jgi:hypothetical protein
LPSFLLRKVDVHRLSILRKDCDDVSLRQSGIEPADVDVCAVLILYNRILLSVTAKQFLIFSSHSRRRAMRL